MENFAMTTESIPAFYNKIPKKNPSAQVFFLIAIIKDVHEILVTTKLLILYTMVAYLSSC